MTTRRLLALAATVPVAALVATMMSAPASARPAVDRADRCLRTTAIPRSAVAGLERSGCSLVGRVVTDGRVSVTVPPPGMSVAGAGVGRHGDVPGLVVSNTGHHVRVVQEPSAREGDGAGGGWYLAPLSSTTSTTSTTRSGTIITSSPITAPSAVKPARAGDPPACKDRTFSLEHHTWRKSLRYRVNLSKMPKRFHKSTVVAQVRAANANMRTGTNTCGRPRITTPASHYLGRTSTKPNISAAGPDCGKGNTTNVVGFADLPGDLLGWTCYWYVGKRMVGTDMLIDNGRSLATKLPSPCSNRWDFEGTVTHEWGHAYGLGHTGDGHSNLTMQHFLTPCSTYARTLGLGDWLGMKKMYGAR